MPAAGSSRGLARKIPSAATGRPYWLATALLRLLGDLHRDAPRHGLTRRPAGREAREREDVRRRVRLAKALEHRRGQHKTYVVVAGMEAGGAEPRATECCFERPVAVR